MTGDDQQLAASPSDSSAASRSGSADQSGTAAGTPSTPRATPSPSLSNEDLGKIFDSREDAKFVFQEQTIKLSTENGLFAEFTFNLAESDPFKEVVAYIDINDIRFTVYPDSSETVVAVDPLGQTRYVFFGSMKYVFDETGKVWSRSDLAKGTLRIEVVMNKDGLTIKQTLLSVISKG